MSAQILSSELSAIIQEAKKKNTELRNASDKALQDLKALPSTSEAQLAGDLQRRPHFVTPFINACKTGNAKLVLPAVTCLQRLIVSGGLAKERLKEALEAFQESSKLSFDVQLKILQSLPSLLQSYVDLLEGETLSTLLQLCITLQQVKTAAISSTASATLQQIVSFVFDRVENEDARGNEVAVSASLALDSGQVYVRPSAHDAYRVLEDLCLLTEGQKTRFLHNAALSQSFGLELIEAVLTNHGEVLNVHPEQAHLLRNLVMPLITRLLSERLNFPITVRTFRVLCLLLREHLNTVQAECEVPLSLLNHMLDAENSNPWRRALCMETFRVLYSTPNLAIDVYAMFDEKNGRRNLIQENLASFVKLSTEKPVLIGIGQQSSFPTGRVGGSATPHDQAMLEAGGVAGIIPGEVGVTEVAAPGISAQWSAMRIPCLDILDKSDPPTIPETYTYSLVLTCTNHLSEALAKVILPLTSFEKPENGQTRPRRPTLVRSESQGIEEVSTANGLAHEDYKSSATTQKRQARAIPTNPLSLEDHPSYSTVCTIAKLVDDCWPAVLATASTFLYAALDQDYYRSLIRSIQKFTQVAGLLRLSTPRDALLTTLAKAAVPPNMLKNETMASPSSGAASPRISSTYSFETISNQITPETASSRSRRDSLDSSGPALSQRNLMCLRALINLGIALGSILEGAWSIILENLQKADAIVSYNGSAASAREYRQGIQSADRQANDAAGGQSTLNAEIAAVEAAVSRLFQSTAEYPNNSFFSVLDALCNLISPTNTNSVLPSSQLRPVTPRRSTSISMLSMPRNKYFAVAKLGEIARINLNRLAFDGVDGGWKLITTQMNAIATSSEEEGSARLMAADVLANAAAGTTAATLSEDTEVRGAVQHRSLSILEVELRTLSNRLHASQSTESGTDIDVHRSALEALRVILEQCGDRLVAGSGNWRIIFSILHSVFQQADSASAEQDGESNNDNDGNKIGSALLPSDKIVRSAFGSIQLICSDFLSVMPRTRVVLFSAILSQCCLQTADLNISLTTIALFWNVSDFLQRHLDDAKTLNAAEPEIDVNDEKGIRTKAAEGSALAMWMTLQRQLAAITEDSRADVRNGAIHTIFRILDNCDTLSSSIWISSLRGVVFKTMQLNINENARSKSSYDNSLIATADLILKSFGNLFSTHLDSTMRLSSDALESLWDAMLEKFAAYLDLCSLELGASVFNCISHVLSVIENSELIGLDSIIKVASLWARNLPSEGHPSETASSSEKALVSYIGCVKEVLRLIGSDIEPAQIKNIASVLQRCVSIAKPTPYSSDVDSTTTLQEQILSSVILLHSKNPDVAAITIPCIAQFATQPYRQSESPSHLSYIAFAKKSMDLLQQIVISNIDNRALYEGGALASALSALADAISRKYKWRRLGKENDLWRRATSAAIEIIKAALQAVGGLQMSPERIVELWRSIVQTACGIADADLTHPPKNETIVKDESFDLASLEALTTALWWPTKDEGSIFSRLAVDHQAALDQGRLWQDYISGMFRNSLLHNGDAPPQESMLSGLYDIRHGRTYDPTFNPRVRMCYFCIDELFALASTTGRVEGQEQSKDLAQRAFPYVVLRCAVPLKRYIADQPLRGRMPTPASQRLELLYVLEKARELVCTVDVDALREEHSTMPTNTVTLGANKRHMEWLVPLINRAIGAARKDDEISAALRLTMDYALRN